MEAGWRIYALVIWQSLVQILACPLIGARLLYEPMLDLCCIFIQENAFESVVSKMTYILPRPQCVKATFPSIYGTQLWSSLCPLMPMMTSSIGNISRVAGLLCREFTGRRWNTLTEASDAELWCFFDEHRDAGDMRCHHAHYDVTVMTVPSAGTDSIVWHNFCEVPIAVPELGYIFTDFT